MCALSVLGFVSSCSQSDSLRRDRERTVLDVDSLDFDESEAKTFFLAEDQLIATCMKARGFTYVRNDYVAGPLELSGRRRRWGPLDLSLVSERGYRLSIQSTAQLDVSVGMKARSDEAFSAMTVDQQDRYQVALSGTGASAKMPPAPRDVSIPGIKKPVRVASPYSDESCRGTTYATLDGGSGSFFALRSDIDLKAASSASFQQTLSRWAACLKVAGYAFADPLEAVDKSSAQGTTSPSPTEVATAVADVRCKQEVSLWDNWREALSSSAAQLATEDAAGLLAWIELKNGMLQRADSAVGH
jgi:hypothetical protein